MKKSFLSIGLLLAACALPLTSCSDYQDDIDNLQDQINAINTTVAGLQKLIDDGAIILSVEKTSDGIIVTTNKGAYSITNGKDGAAGANADVWTIGTDGYWYKNGAKTDYRAIGENGAPGTPGEAGAVGATGNYYRPNPETGCFDLVNGVTGEVIEHTDISYRSSSSSTTMTAVYTGNKIIFTGVEGATNGIVEMPLGTSVGSLVFIPSVYDSKLPYATTDEPFYYLPTYLSESKYNTSTKVFTPQNWNASNIVDLRYRINPADAYVANNASVVFINRQVVSRAAGDKDNLLQSVGVTAENAELNVSARINPMNLSGENVVTARLWNGQDPVTSSDYVAVDAQAVTASIFNTKASTRPVYYFDRTKALPSASDETDAFIKSFVPLTAVANINVQYNQSVDLSEYVGLWCNTLSKTMAAVGFEGETFKFSLPSDYLSDDTQKTNQQWFAQLEGSVFSANSKNLTSGLTPAINRTPVVRVDAYLPDNNGNVQMVASAYIKIQFTEQPTSPTEDKEKLVINLGEKSFNYSQLKATATQIGQMNWQAVNNQIYGSQGLTVDNFWNNYKNTYKVTLDVVTNAAGATRQLYTGTGTVGTPFTYAQDGITTSVLFTNTSTQTSQIDFKVDNMCKTDLTYYNFEGKGAKFTVTITLEPNNSKVKQPIEIKQVFYVLNDFNPYKFNENFEVPGYSPARVQTLGEVSTNGWVMQLNIAQAFKKINGKDIFQYFADATADASYGNIKANPEIAFGFNGSKPTGVEYGTPTFANHIVGLTQALTSSSKLAPMKYTVELVNTEKLSRNFDVEFINPFVSGTPKTIVINGNNIGTQTANAAQSVIVNERNTTNAIYSYVNNALALSSRATDFFKLQSSQVSVSYAWNKNKGDWAAFAEQLPQGSSLSDVATTNGIIEYNSTAVLQKDRTLYINATVTFKNLSVVVVEIPVQFKK